MLQQIAAKFGRNSPIVLRRGFVRALRRVLRGLPERPFADLPAGLWAPRVGGIDFGHLDRTTPIGEVFGPDRGKPIDRLYIERFLDAHRGFIRGRVLEVGDSSYTRAFGGSAVTRADVLHVSGDNPIATIVGDIADPATLPEGAFDCIVLTQTLHLIFDMPAAVRNVVRALAPGGTLLLTVPGVSAVDPWEWRDNWYWSLTPPALERLLRAEFAADDIDLTAFGNVHAAIAFLAGASVEDVDPAKLAVVDRHFPVVVAARATKAGAA
ncbi:class I SAM-dependent methyltransferase [Novosphingobium sp. KCTC 2891]|uniref:class I SAM-dependent methyltransferase n=1 Tax=Novosphingobium sp. KCTC 2891 TaxID=2989730 RepID=UPI0022228166|nr:class I SAM-dependent methyltransferase [Novosphingobium sp. KCTC 2891]MCW1382704.1 class I SAM-dependent methyltransferase [Novosphingobium sp. KCTC 2891]